MPIAAVEPKPPFVEIDSLTATIDPLLPVVKTSEAVILVGSENQVTQRLMTELSPYATQREKRRTQYAGFPRSLSVALFSLLILFAHTAYGDINADLLEAAKIGNTAKVEQLLNQGADTNTKNEKGTTALMWAAYESHTETVKALIEAGADANAKTEDGWTAMMDAAAFGSTVTVKAFIDAGADVNAETKDGKTVLVWAAERGQTENVKALMDAGANVNAETKDGKTVLMIAAGKGHTEIVDILKQAGARR